MENFDKIGSSRKGSRESKNISNNNRSHYSSHTEGDSSYTYTAKAQNASFLSPQSTDFASDAITSGQSGGISGHNSRRSDKPNENIKLMPFKVKDVMQMIKNNPAYRDKSPVMINMKENDIDRLIEQQRSGNLIRLTASQQQSLMESTRESPLSMSTRQSEEDKSIQQSPVSYAISSNDEVLQSSRTLAKQAPQPNKPPLGEAQTQQVFAMTGETVGSRGFRAQKSARRRPRARSRKASPARRPRSRRRPRSKVRSRSRRRRSRPTKIVRARSRRRSPIVVKKRRYYPAMDYCCNPYPMCDNTCTMTFQPHIFPRSPPPRSPSLRSPSPRSRPSRYVTSRAAFGNPISARNRIFLRDQSRSKNRQVIMNPTYSPYPPRITRSGMSVTCDCNLCQDKLQFIQPGVCTKRKDIWTNEYAIIPKKQINLIDPCEELDPLIYPRADNPCIRDGHGNPLTDCIGRPLRDPVGKKFLNFSADGSVLDTSIRGNFYTGQPPLCVKCPLPTNTCAPDATHNWWMSCGYPVQPDMSPFYRQVLAADHFQRRF
uniref:Uncharacterized protein n=1 Tax=Cuerna arida TaxID=1464854 RepID=A0A1B6H279_9HEMI